MKCRALMLSAFALFSLAAFAQTSADKAEFIVLRTDRVTTYISTGNSAHINCSIIGTGDFAQMSCNSYSSGGSIPLVYHTALLVGSNQVGYVVSCGGGLIRRIGCQPLSVGQRLEGSIRGDKLTLALDDKHKTYKIQTSAYIGPLTAKTKSANSSETPSEQHSGSAPLLKNVVQLQPSSAPSSSDNSQNANVAFSSEPSGADIYVDGKSVGNTPSMIQLASGDHEVRIEAVGRKPWTRSLHLTAGAKVNLAATFVTEE